MTELDYNSLYRIVRTIDFLKTQMDMTITLSKMIPEEERYLFRYILTVLLTGHGG